MKKKDNLVGIIGAMEEEIKILKSNLVEVDSKLYAGIEFFYGILQERNFVIAKCGIGKVNAAICTQIMIDKFGVDCIINTGVAGALDGRLKISDIVISTETVHHDIDTAYFGDEIGTIPNSGIRFIPANEYLIDTAYDVSVKLFDKEKIYKGRVASGDQFISSTVQKQKIIDNVSAMCCEMEGAAIGQVCHLNNVPYLVIRAISDNADDSSGMTYDKFLQIAADNSAKLVFELVKNI